MCLCFLQLFFLVIDIQSHSVVVREDAWYDLSFLKFTEVLFVTKNVVFPGECSWALEKKVYSSAFGWNVLKIPMRSISSNVSFKTCVSLLIFCFDDLSIGVSGVLKSPAIIVLLSISPFMSVGVCLMCWGAPMLNKQVLSECMGRRTADCPHWHTLFLILLHVLAASHNHLGKIVFMWLELCNWIWR